MRSAMRRNIFKEIKNTFGRFLSIFAIVALGVGFFAGLKATPPVMEKTADEYYDLQNLMDIRLLSTMGFTEEDVEAIENVPGIKQVDATYSIDALAESKSGIKALKLHALSKDSSGMNKPMLVEGRLPEKSGECVLDKKLAGGDFGGIGDTLTISGENEADTLDMLKTHQFTITGIVDSPYYISVQRGTTGIGNGNIAGFVMIPKEAFDSDYYLELYTTVEDAKELSCYSDKYAELIDDMTDKLETVAKQRETIRYDEIVREAQKKLDDSRKELANSRSEAEDKLAAAKIELDEGQDKINSGKEKINTSERQLEASTKQLQEQEKQYQVQSEQAEAQLKSAAAEIEKQWEQYKAAESTGTIAEEQLAQMKQGLEKAEAELAQKQAAAAVAGAQAKAQFEAARKKLSNGYIELDKAMAELEAAQAELQSGRLEYEKKKAEADKELADAQEKIDEAQKKIDEIKKPEWYVLDRDTNYGVKGYGDDADRINKITNVFPVFFFMVAALVCLTTMARMVEEQRTQIGVLKALGYSKVTIAMKFLIYAGSASVLGSIVGLAVGLVTFPTVIHNAYCIMYALPPASLSFNVESAVLSSIAAILCTTLATLWACYYELKSTPAELVRPKAPAKGKRVLMERIGFVWNRLSFIQKVTARNLFRYKKRFLMTILGIGGCTALLLTGFGLMDSIMGIVDRQFGILHSYDVSISLIDSGNSSEESKLNSKLGDYLKDSLYVMQTSVDAVVGDEKVSSYLFVPENAQRLNEFIAFRKRIGGKKVEFPQTGKVILSEKLSEKLKVSAGDKIIVKKGEFEKAEVVVGDITENYIYDYIYMSPEDYESAFGYEPEYKQIIGNVYDSGGLTKEKEETISENLLKLDNVGAVSMMAALGSDFANIMKSLNSVVILIIICANILAFVVLYNLTNVNITERVREIATIKVLGFYDPEVSAYVYRENFVLTLLGIIAGLVGGVFLHRFVVVTAEVDIAMFERKVKALSYLWSALFTLGFAGLVNFFMYFKLKKISMVESLKSIE